MYMTLDNETFEMMFPPRLYDYYECKCGTKLAVEKDGNPTNIGCQGCRDQVSVSSLKKLAPSAQREQSKS